MLKIDCIVLVVYPCGEELFNKNTDPYRPQSCMLIYKSRVMQLGYVIIGLQLKYKKNHNENI